jgi:hypothetical protein
VWAPYWYDGVWRSTGFRPPAAPTAGGLDPALEPLLEQCLPFYERMAKNKIRINGQNEPI